MKHGASAYLRSRGFLAATLLGTLMAATAQPAPTALASDDTIVIARDVDFNSLDPSRSWCDSCQIYLTATYEQLIRVGKDNQTLEPRLATSWDVLADGLTYTFKLDPAARFSDGSAVEAKDVKFSLLRLKNLKEGPSFFASGIKQIDTPDAGTVIVTLSEPDPEFLGKMSAPFSAIMNSDIVIANGGNAGVDAASQDTAETWLLANSAGSGAFVLETYRPDDELRLARNENYWRDKPAPSMVVIREVQDSVAQAQLLQSGGADIAMQIDTDTAEAVKSDDIVTEFVSSYNFIYVALAPGAEANKVPLTPKVREAIAAAIDYEGVLQFTTGGRADLIAAAVPNGFPGTEGLPMPKQDLDKARALLSEAGLADGFEIEAAYPQVNVYGVDLGTMMQKVQQDLSKVGVKLTLQPVTFPVWSERIGSSGIPVTAVFFAPDYYGSGQYAGYFSMVPGARWYDRAGGDKVEGLVNQRALQLLKDVRTASPEDAPKIYKELAMEMIKDKIILPLVNPQLVLAHAKGIEGVRYAICCNLPLEELSKR